MKREFLKPLAVSVATLLSASQAQAALPVYAASEISETASSKPLAGDGLVLARATEQNVKGVANYGHQSHSSHASHASHRSHYSSAY